MKIILRGLPQSTNNLYRSHCRFGHPVVYMTTDGKILKESYGWQAKQQWKQEVSGKPIEVNVELYFGDKRIHDIDNYEKILYDSLTGICYEDDRQIWKKTVAKFYDKNNPRIEIYITESL